MKTSEEDLKKTREDEIYQKTYQYFYESYVNLITPVGPSGQFDMAFGINRKEIILRSLKDLVITIEESKQ